MQIVITFLDEDGNVIVNYYHNLSQGGWVMSDIPEFAYKVEIRGR